MTNECGVDYWEDGAWRIIHHRQGVDALIATNLETSDKTLVLSNAHNFVLDRLRNQNFTPTQVLTEPLIQRYLRKMN